MRVRFVASIRVAVVAGDRIELIPRALFVDRQNWALAIQPIGINQCSGITKCVGKGCVAAPDANWIALNVSTDRRIVVSEVVVVFRDLPSEG